MFGSSKRTKVMGVLFVLAIVHAATLCVFGQSRSALGANRIHCVTDISHEFTFYFDGRFGRNYVGENGINVQNWGTLSKYDFANANLLILQSSSSPCQYTPADISAVRQFIYEGGGVLVLGDYTTFRNEKQYRLNALAKQFKAEFINQKANKPLKGSSFLSDKKIDSYSPKTINRTQVIRSTPTGGSRCSWNFRPVNRLIRSIGQRINRRKTRCSATACRSSTATT